MFDFTVDTKSLNKFRDKFIGSIGENMSQALDNIRVEWGYTLHKQQLRFHRNGNWVELSPAYKARKDKEFKSRAKTEARYNTMLRRTGKMLKGYVEGMHIDIVNNKIEMPYSDRYARAHQLGYGNLPARPFEVEEFHQVAVNEFKKAIAKRLK